MLDPKVLLEKNKKLQYLKKLGLDIEKVRNSNLMLQSFVHKSFAADSKKISDHNERLEFLGDSVLGAIICKLLFIKNPKMDESEMTLYKIALVREENLAQVAKNIFLDQEILLSKGEEKMQGRKKDAILADSLEAIIGYMFIDFGYNVVEEFVSRYVYTMYDKIEKRPIQSYKTMVQELMQKKHKQIPEYTDFEEKTDEKGNTTLYKAEIKVLGKKQSQGFGTNKKKAQEDAAKNLYEKII